MRTKALLVAAGAGAQGPIVVLDGGVWEIDASNPFIKLQWEGEGEQVNGKVRLKGRVRVSSVVSPEYKGRVIHLDAKQVG
jgi:hypothetical protein